MIVSLKDGMFNHANVLFKTRFADGTSTVTRTENRSNWSGEGGADEIVGGEGEPEKKRRRKS